MSNPCKLAREEVLVNAFALCVACGYEVFAHKPDVVQKFIDDHHECPDDVDCWCERATRGMKEELDAIINSKVLEAIERIRGALPDTTFHGSSIRVKQNIRDNGYADGIYDVRVILKEIEKEYK